MWFVVVGTDSTKKTLVAEIASVRGGASNVSKCYNCRDAIRHEFVVDSLQFVEYLTVSLLEKPFPLQFVSHFYGEERCKTIILDPQRKRRPTNCSWYCQYVDIRCAFVAHLIHSFWSVLHRCPSPATLIHISLCVVVIRFCRSASK